MQLPWAGYVLLSPWGLSRRPFLQGRTGGQTCTDLLLLCRLWVAAGPCPCVQVARLVEPVTGPSRVPGRGESCCK